MITKYLTKKNLITLLSYAGVTIGVVGSLLGIYSFFQKDFTQVEYEIITNTRVVDIRENLGELDIIYKGNSILKNNSKLNVVEIKVVNTGTRDILPTFYDDNDLLGLAIPDSEIIDRPVIIKTSNDYLKRNVRFLETKPNILRFPKLIIEKDQSFTFKILVLQKNANIPEVVPIGKIAGLNRVQVTETYKLPTDNKYIGFIKLAFLGNIFIQLARTVAYFFLFILIIATTVFLTFSLNKLIKRQRRYYMILEFKKTNQYRTSDSLDKILNIYINEGFMFIFNVDDLLNNKGRLKEYSENNSEHLTVVSNINGERRVFMRSRELLDKVKKYNFAEIKKDKLIVNKKLQEDLIILKKFLVNNKEKLKYDTNDYFSSYALGEGSHDDTKT